METACLKKHQPIQVNSIISLTRFKVCDHLEIQLKWKDFWMTDAISSYILHFISSSLLLLSKYSLAHRIYFNHHFSGILFWFPPGNACSPSSSPHGHLACNSLRALDLPQSYIMHSLRALDLSQAYISHLCFHQPPSFLWRMKGTL